MVGILTAMVRRAGYAVLIEEDYKYDTDTNMMRISAMKETRPSEKYGLAVDFGTKRPWRIRVWLWKVWGLWAVLRKVTEVENTRLEAA